MLSKPLGSTLQEVRKQQAIERDRRMSSHGIGKGTLGGKGLNYTPTNFLQLKTSNNGSTEVVDGALVSVEMGGDRRMIK